MKKIALSLLLLLSSQSYAASAKLVGFVGLNLLSYENVSNTDDTLTTGFDMFQATLIGQRDQFTAKMKLNFDLSKDDLTADSFHLFEEVKVTYNYEDMIQATVGKGELPFNSFHFGALKPYLVDGGSFYDHDSFRPTHFRHDEGVLLMTLAYLNENRGTTNELSLFGRDVTQEGYNNTHNDERSEKTFNAREQRGAANKFTYQINEKNKVVASALWYKHDLWPEANYAAQAFYEFAGDALNVWGGYLYGNYQAHHNAGELRKNTYHVAWAKEHVFQLGAEYEVNDLINVYTNGELYLTTNREYQRTSKGFWRADLDDLEHEYQSMRLEVGTKFKMAKDAFVNVGVVHERNSHEFVGTGSVGLNKDRYTGYAAGDTIYSNTTAVMSTLSYWF